MKRIGPDNGHQCLVLESRMARWPAVAMGHLMAPVGGQRLHRTIAWDDDVACPTLGPGTGIRPGPALAAQRTGLRERKYHLHDGTPVGMVIYMWGRENEDHFSNPLTTRWRYPLSR
jgi:hypothetical protein